MNIDISKAKLAVEKFSKEVTDYTTKNKLSDLPEYKNLQTKGVIGSLYRQDQYYFEKVSGYRADYFALKSYFLKVKSDTTDRAINRTADLVINYIDQKIKLLDSFVSIAKQRIKFYDSMIYLISNMSYGDY